MTTQLKRYTSKLKWKLSSSAKDAPGDDLNLASAAFGGLDDDRLITLIIVSVCEIFNIVRFCLFFFCHYI